jgi:hypothetical protein
MENPLKLTNPEIELEIGGETFHVKKATLEKVIPFQERFTKLIADKDVAADAKLAAYCIYLILKDVKPDVTEEWAMQNVPGDVEALTIIEQLGFMNRQKVDQLRKLTEKASAIMNAPERTGE